MSSLTQNLKPYQLGPYVYRHVHPKTGVPFYVGSGCRSRAWSLRRNKQWHEVVGRHGFKVEIVRYCDNRIEALALEAKLISAYRACGLPLVNQTDGGIGPAGLRHTDQAKQKMSLAKRGKNLGPRPEVGTAISDAKLGKPTKATKPIKCIETGEVWASVGYAARCLGANAANLSKHLAGRKYYKTIKGRTFKYVEGST